MAGSTPTKTKSMKKKKRKHSTSEGSVKPSKSARKINNAVVEDTETLENLELDEEVPLINIGAHQWRNLELALAIQKHELNDQLKVELIFEFMNSRDNGMEEDFNTYSIQKLIADISKWIQSLLITSAKKFGAGDKDSEELWFFLDQRCWEILKFCLKESEKLHVWRDMLRVISGVAKSVLHSLSFADIDTKELTFTSVEVLLFNTVVDCLKLLFIPNSRLSAENLDLWTVAVSSLLELVIRIYSDKFQDSSERNLVTEFSCLVLEPFAKFLRLHPCRKNGFRDFVDKLLEPLLHLLGLLQDKIKDKSPVLVQNLFKLVEEIISYGLFHPIHLDEYLSLHITAKYSSADEKLKNARTFIKSYHRHIFDKVENLVSEKKIQALSGIGELFRLFVVSVKELKRELQDTGTLRTIETHDTKHLSKVSNLTSEKSYATTTPASDIRMSFFDFFVLSMEPLLLDLSNHLQADFQSGTSLQNVYYTLKFVNKILSSMVCESAYLRMEDNSGGACLNFFKISHGLLMSCYAKFNQFCLSTWSVDNFVQVETLKSMAKEFILAVGNFLDIEYGVIGDDLVSIWLMILTCLSLAHSSEDVQQLCPLFSLTVDLGCRLINLYSELRQVDHAIFALCKGLRHLSFQQRDNEIQHFELSTFNSYLHYDKFSKSGCLLLNSQKFRLAISNVIKSIPEGQIADVVQTLSSDMLDCLEWMKVGHSVIDEHEVGDALSCRFSAQAEIFGVVLPEIYTLVLDSLSVSAGYSYRMGESIEKMIVVLRPSMRHLTTLEQDGPDGFVFTVLGINLNKNLKCKNDILNKMPLLLLFFFRVYVSCRNLYRQALSLMPPDSSTKMSKVMSDYNTAYSGKDCMERTKFKDKGYFSWVKSSVSLLSIMQYIKYKFFPEGSADNCCLIYVMHIMALQRLVDLSRQIHSVEYILRCSENGRCNELMDDADQSVPLKGKRKQEKFLSALKQEAAGLTGFIMEYISTVDEKQHPISNSSRRATNGPTRNYLLSNSWDLGVCTVNEKTLHTAIWWIICRNMDIWCQYATKKKLKLFLSLLILNSLPYRTFGEFEEQSETYAGKAMKVTKHQIAQELLHDTSFYDQRFVRRYMPSRVCHILKKCVSPLFNDSTNIGAELGPSDWTSGLNVLQNSAKSMRDKPITSCCAHGDLVNEQSDKVTPFTPTNMLLAACRSLLDLLCMMGEISLSFKSLSRSVIYLINFERLIIGFVLDSPGSLCIHEHHEFLRLLVTCRRALKYLLMTFCVENSEVCESTDILILLKVPSSILWLLESVKLVSEWWNTLSTQNKSSQCNDLFVSLRDQTSYVFVTLCKHQFGSAINSIVSFEKARKSVLDCEDNHPDDVYACKSVIMIVEALEEETKNFLLSLKEAFSDGDLEVDVQPVELSKLSSAVSCIQGFLWGLESALNVRLASGNDLQVKVIKSKHNIMSRVDRFVNLLMELLVIASRIFLHKNHPVKVMYDGQGQLNLDNDNHVMGTAASLEMDVNYGSDTKLENQILNSGSEMMILAACELQNGSDSRRKKKRFKSDSSHSAIYGLTEFNSFNYNCLRTDLLGSFLDGQNLEAAFFLRGLFFVSSAIVRLSMLMDCSSLSSNLIQIFLGCSEVLLTRFSEMLDFPSSASFVWLDGSVKFLEAVGSLFASSSPITTRNVYTKLVELHLKAIGKCISLQGKGARLASHIGSSAKIYTEGRNHESTVSNPLCGLDNLKARLRMSFKYLIENSSEPLLSSALQSLERALDGIRDGFPVICEVKKDSSTGGTVSAMVAGAVDCLDLLLEFYKGKKQLNVVRSRINSLFASLFKIMAHLQGPSVFLMKPNGISVKKNPDSGSVVLMCVEVLTRISGKRAQFHLDSYRVGQSLRIPEALSLGFSFIGGFGASKDCHQSFTRLDIKEYGKLESYFLVDRKFSVNLYAACCRLLWTVVKHRKSECVPCIAILQNSLRVLLRCLEIVNSDSEDQKAYFTWVVEDGVECASYLRRVYEEIGQQKDILGQYCFLFLMDYITIYSGYGPLKRGIKREVDEALRPGVYALLDVCSADDLQLVHTALGEGSCRSTLASLKNDHKRQQYEGKV